MNIERISRALQKQEAKHKRKAADVFELDGETTGMNGYALCGKNAKIDSDLHDSASDQSRVLGRRLGR